MDFRGWYREMINPLIQQFNQFPWENRDAYCNWLGQTYYYVNSSTRILGMAGCLFDFSKQNLHNRFIDHAKEERGHEKLLTNDLKFFGKSIADFPELPETAAFYQSQYYWIQHVSPVSLFGYIFTLEGLAVECGKKAFETVCNSHGKKAGSFLMVHSNEDIAHIESAVTEASKLGSADVDLISKNMRVSAGLYSQMLTTCAAAGKISQEQKVA